MRIMMHVTDLQCSTQHTMVGSLRSVTTTHMESLPRCGIQLAKRSHSGLMAPKAIRLKAPRSLEDRLGPMSARIRKSICAKCESSDWRLSRVGTSLPREARATTPKLPHMTPAIKML